jgi:hypothetical protein
MKTLFYLLAMGLLIQANQAKAGSTPPSGGAAAMCIGVLSGLGLDPIGLGLTGSSAPSETPKASKSESKARNDFDNLASNPSAVYLMYQSASGNLNTRQIIK